MPKSITLFVSKLLSYHELNEGFYTVERAVCFKINYTIYDLYKDLPSRKQEATLGKFGMKMRADKGR